MTARHIPERIQAANLGRAPDLVRRKYAFMRRNPFVFFRGTAHLFFEDWPATSPLSSAPVGWVCGDLHVENFGCYKGVERLTYFDVNDFDEACLGPVTWDVTRLLTSIVLGAPLWGISAHESTRLVSSAAASYASALKAGTARWVERDMARGVVKKMFAGLGKRSRRELLDERTELHKRRRMLAVDGVRLLAATPAQAEFAAELVGVAARQLDGVRYVRRPSFFAVEDVARRVAGMGSLGVQRYVVMVSGKGGPNRHVLLDIKASLPSFAAKHAPVTQPVWGSESSRIVAVQSHLQAEPPALLTSVSLDEMSFVVKELQPSEDKLTLVNRTTSVTDQLLGELAHLAVWMHLRGGGWRGAATADEYIAFGADASWRAAAEQYARDYARVVQHDYAEFSRAYDKGAFESPNAP